MTAVALLNASYEPLGTVTFQHAVRMLVRQVATVEEAHDDRMIGPHPWPRVIRLVRYVAATWMYRPAPYSRRGVLLRDGHRCAYCGSRASTIDHVLPRSRGGAWTWANTGGGVRALQPPQGQPDADRGRAPAPSRAVRAHPGTAGDCARLRPGRRCRIRVTTA